MRLTSLFSFAGLFLVAAPHRTATAGSDLPSLLAAGQRLIHQKQPVPDDPLAGLPTGDGDRDDQHDHGKTSNKGAHSCRLNANPANSHEVGDLRATLAFVQRGPQAWPCPSRPGPSAEVRLRIAVDGSGKITDAQAAGGDANVAAALAKKLVGQSIAPRPEGPTQGTVVLGFASSRK
jgi:hypothetical protein